VTQRPGDAASMTRQAVVLVGGKGTRLGEQARNTPKPLLPIDGEAVFLDEVIFQIARHGFEEILLLAGHLHEQVTSRYEGKTALGARLSVLIEPSPAGTGGALAMAAERLDPSFLFANGDTLFDINLRRLDAELANSPQAAAVLALRRVPDAGRYGSVQADAGRILRFEEKRADASGSTGLVNGGIGVFRRDVLRYVASPPCSIETDVYPKLAADDRLRGEEFDGYFLDIGLPETLAQAREELPRRRRRPALFLDRDGVLNRDEGYTHKPEDLEWVPGAIETIRRANDIGAFVVVVTNQAGVAHGFYEIAHVERFHAAMRAELAARGAHVDAFYMCPYHPEAGLAQWRCDHPDRKPKPGMLLRALVDWPIDRGASVLIGDRDSDVQAAKAAGVRGLFFAGGNLSVFARDALDAMAAARASSGN